jgi:hypothetical protein
MCLGYTYELLRKYPENISNGRSIGAAMPTAASSFGAIMLARIPNPNAT